MKSKYHEMHRAILTLCSEQNLRLIPGRVAYLEAKEQTVMQAEKNFFLFENDFEKLEALLADGLGEHYRITTAPADDAFRWIRVERTDILAASMENLFKYPKASVYPRIIIKIIKQAADTYVILQNRKEKHIPAALLEHLAELEYAEGTVYPPEDVTAFFGLVYNMENPLAAKVAGYEIFDEEIDAVRLLEEAKKRGILTKKQKARFRDFETWRREIEKPALKAYLAYQNELLALTLSDED
ncbi:MAG: hypothetical protein IKJ77_06670 [Firmicutes bacterium]|nr:hypothetical protein [Bacillota bacterium]